MAVPSRIQVADVDGVMVVRFNDHQLFDERTVREVAEQIAIDLPSDGTPIRLILDFTDVSLLSSIAAEQAHPDPAAGGRVPRQASALRALAGASAGLPHLEPRPPVHHRPRPAGRRSRRSEADVGLRSDPGPDPAAVEEAPGSTRTART